MRRCCETGSLSSNCPIIHLFTAGWTRVSYRIQPFSMICACANAQTAPSWPAVTPKWFPGPFGTWPPLFEWFLHFWHHKLLQLHLVLSPPGISRVVRNPGSPGGEWYTDASLWVRTCSSQVGGCSCQALCGQSGGQGQDTPLFTHTGTLQRRYVTHTSHLQFYLSDTESCAYPPVPQLPTQRPRVHFRILPVRVCDSLLCCASLGFPDPEYICQAAERPHMWAVSRAHHPHTGCPPQPLTRPARRPSPGHLPHSGGLSQPTAPRG